MSLWDRTRGTCHILLTGWSLVKRAEGVVLVAPAGSCISPCPVDGGGGFHAVASFWVAATSGRGVWVGAVGPKRGRPTSAVAGLVRRRRSAGLGGHPRGGGWPRSWRVSIVGPSGLGCGRSSSGIGR